MRLNEDEALDRFRAARVARLATVSAAGAPHLVPVTFAVSPAPGPPVVVIAVDHKPKTTVNLRRLRNITATGRVSQNWPFPLVDYWNATTAPDPQDFILKAKVKTPA